MTHEKAQKGDLIRIVNVMDEEFDPYKVGDILEVLDRRNGYDVWVKFNGVRRCVADIEYVIHRKAGEEESDYEMVIRTLEEFSTDGAEVDATISFGLVKDAVNSPTHYTQGKFETIEIIEHLTSKYDDGFTAHCVGTAFKYMDRAPYKHDTPTECLRKAAKYIEFAIERLDAKSTQK